MIGYTQILDWEDKIKEYSNMERGLLENRDGIKIDYSGSNKIC
jgi:hypothetical protein